MFLCTVFGKYADSSDVSPSMITIKITNKIQIENVRIVIFALVLTFVYVVYFAVMITLDLHGKKDEKKTEEETYDVGDLTNEEQPVAIEERNEGPDEGDMTFTEQITDDGLRVVNPTGKRAISATSFR